MTDLQLSGFDKDGNFWLKAEEFNDDAYMAALEIGKTYMLFKGGVTFNVVAGHLKNNGFKMFTSWSSDDRDFGLPSNRDIGKATGPQKTAMVKAVYKSSERKPDESAWVGFTQFFYDNFDNIHANRRLEGENRVQRYLFARKSYNQNNRSLLATDSYLRLLEFYELLEARKNAQQARYLSVIAIIISLIALIATASVGIFQIKQMERHFEFNNRNHPSVKISR